MLRPARPSAGPWQAGRTAKANRSRACRAGSCATRRGVRGSGHGAGGNRKNRGTMLLNRNAAALGSIWRYAVAATGGVQRRAGAARGEPRRCPLKAPPPVPPARRRDRRRPRGAAARKTARGLSVALGAAARCRRPTTCRWRNGPTTSSSATACPLRRQQSDARRLSTRAGPPAPTADDRLRNVHRLPEARQAVRDHTLAVEYPRFRMNDDREVRAATPCCSITS